MYPIINLGTTLLLFLASKLPDHTRELYISKSWRLSSFRVSFYLPSTLIIYCHVHVLSKRHQVLLECGQFLPFPCSFGNKCMCLLNHVYGNDLVPMVSIVDRFHCNPTFYLLCSQAGWWGNSHQDPEFRRLLWLVWRWEVCHAGWTGELLHGEPRYTEGPE